MPLPAALLQRLQKRGLVDKAEEEEVFAENYDEEESGSESEEDDKESERGGAPGCPNKWNQFHLCTDFCYDQWQEGIPESRLSEQYLHDKNTMLLKYPLPEGWKEVYDPGVRRHYYWFPDTDEVCWLSPKHPAAVISPAANKIAREMFDDLKSKHYQEEVRKEESKFGGKRGGRFERKKRPVVDQVDRASPPPTTSIPLPTEPAAAMVRNEDGELVPQVSERDRLKKARRRGLDPMDPSAYSDCPEGNWGAGLYSEAKTGVDSTVTGPLFQQRPYPAPGAILRKNQEKK